MRRQTLLLFFYAAAAVLDHKVALAGNFGVDGDVGLVGESAQDGASAPNLTVNLNTELATNSYPLILAAGQDGFDGADGQSGADATQCAVTPSPTGSMTGASGGRGGDGGHAGNGGNGGDLTLIFSSFEQLRTVTFIGSGGRAGEPGRGGDGGQGCSCRTSISPAPVACRDGRDGEKGRDGRPGKDGRMGRLRLVPGGGLEPQAERLHFSDSLANILQRDVVLVKNKWLTKTGARELLGPHSDMDDTYVIFDNKTATQRFHLDWNDPQVSRERLARMKGTFNAGESTINYTLHDESGAPLLYKGVTSYDAPTSRVNLRVDRVVTLDDFQKFSFQSTNGSERNLRIVVEDQAGKADAFEGTIFTIDYRTRDPFAYHTQINATLPASAVTRDGNLYILDVGSLPITKEKYREAGTKVEMTLRVTRRLLDVERTQDYEWKFRI